MWPGCSAVVATSMIVPADLRETPLRSMRSACQASTRSGDVEVRTRVIKASIVEWRLVVTSGSHQTLARRSPPASPVPLTEPQQPPAVVHGVLDRIRTDGRRTTGDKRQPLAALATANGRRRHAVSEDAKCGGLRVTMTEEHFFSTARPLPREKCTPLGPVAAARIYASCRGHTSRPAQHALETCNPQRVPANLFLASPLGLEDAWGNPVDLSPRSATIRVVPQDVKDPDGGQDDNLDYLAPALSRLELGQPLDPHEPKDTLRQPPRQGVSKVSRRSLDKPLPETPGAAERPDSGSYEPLNFDRKAHESPTEKFYGKSKDDLERELGVSGVLDLKNSEDTTIHTHYAPAVTHETIREDVKEVRHEEIHREIHTHDIYHRILPIQRVEILPAKHYVQDADGRRREVSADQVPGRSPKLTQALLSECFKDTLPKSGKVDGPREFSARDFRGTEGKYREDVKPDGSLQTSRTWIHPPTLQKGAEQTGQSIPFHFDD